MGTRTYGKDTGAGFSTFEELRFIKNEPKPFFLVKMCERFEEAETRFRLDPSVAYFQWLPGQPMSGDLVPQVLERLSSLTGGVSSSILPVGTEKEKKVYENGDVYEGELKDDKRNGKGKFVCKTGTLYEGDWKDDKKHGKGTMRDNEDTYDGNWVGDLRHGKGKVHLG
jgi:hypothetical protein